MCPLVPGSVGCFLSFHLHLEVPRRANEEREVLLYRDLPHVQEKHTHTLPSQEVLGAFSSLLSFATLAPAESCRIDFLRDSGQVGPLFS